MKKICLLLFITLLHGCAVVNYFHVREGIKKLELGMTVREVVKVMGKNYEVVEVSHRGRVLEYENDHESYYRLYFVNDVLVEWAKEYKYPSGFDHRHSSGNSSLRFHFDAHHRSMLSGASSDAGKAHIDAHIEAHTRAHVAPHTPPHMDAHPRPHRDPHVH